MRYLSILTLLVIVLTTTLTPARAKAGLWPVEVFDVMDNQRIVVFLRDGDIAASPKWQPAEGGPPLTIAGALEHVRQWIAEDPRLMGAEIYEIELKPIHGHEQEHRWYYLMQLRAVKDGKRKAFYAAVLLNGKVVPAIAEPAAIK